MIKTFELPLTREYVRHWTTKKAVQELLQNALDSPAKFEHEFFDCGDGTTGISIRSAGVKLPASSLLLGSTSKAEDDDTIGSFGEGYKIALLVLTRLGKDPVVVNDGVRWSTAFTTSTVFGADVLCITERPDPDSEGEGLTFRVEGLTDEEVEEITASCLHMQTEEAIGKVVKCPQGSILLERAGELYVNGLFVCSTELTYGYNIKPSYLKLDRERQAVSSFDLAWLTKEMWFTTKDKKLIAQLIADGAPELIYANHGAPADIKEACVEHLAEVGGEDAYIASSPAEAKQLKEAGAVNPVYYNTALHGCVTTAASYKPPQTVVIQTPSSILQLWYDKNKKYMKRLPATGFKLLVEQSENWRVK